MNPNFPEMQLPPHVQEKFDEEIRTELIRQNTEQELRTNPLFRSFFAQFNPASVDSFIRSYARRKAIYLTRGPQYLDQKEQTSLRHKMLAEEALWAIQQKKLFNLQCQWRAEVIKLKGVLHSTQFSLLSSNIQYCPYISPVSRAEVDLYISYLKSGTASHMYSFDNWQDYEAFRAEFHSGSDDADDNAPEHMPSWYRFYDEHMGTSSLLWLPDYRGEKENRYRSLARQRQLETVRNRQNAKMDDSRPFLSIFDTQVVESFVKRFENGKLLRYCRAVEEFQQQLDQEMEVDEALNILRNAGRTVQVYSNPDWKNAIIDAARNFELEQVATLLPAVHQEYIIRIENGINFPQSIADKKREEHAFQVCEIARMQILEGRRTLGEPEDLCF